MNSDYLEDTETGLDKDGKLTPRAWGAVIHRCESSISRAYDQCLPVYAKYVGRDEFDEDAYLREEVRERLDVTITNEIANELEINLDEAKKIYDKSKTDSRTVILKESMFKRIVMRLQNAVDGLYRVYDDFDDGDVVFNDDKPGGLWSVAELEKFLRAYAISNPSDSNDRIIARCVRVNDGDTVTLDSFDYRH